MNDITNLMQRLKEAASKATQGEWQVYEEHVSTKFDAMYIFSQLIQGTAGEQETLYMLSADGLCPALTGTGPNSKNNAEFIALANPANILALIAALESRSVTVKLPQKNIGWDRDEDDCWNNAIDACAEALTNAGFKVVNQ